MSSMPYDILSSDVTDSRNNTNNNSNLGPYDDSDSTPPPNRMKYVMIALHICLVLGCLFLIYVIFVTPFLFEDDSNFKLTGEVSSFSTTLNQTIIINVQDYTLNLESGTQLSGENDRFVFQNFTGTLNLVNNSFLLKGLSPRLETKTSEINAKNQEIILQFEKGGVELQLDSIVMNVSANLDISYKPDLIYATQKESIISIRDFNGTLSYDQLLGLYGHVDTLSIENNESSISFR